MCIVEDKTKSSPVGGDLVAQELGHIQDSGQPPQTDKELIAYLDRQIHIYAEENGISVAEATRELMNNVKNTKNKMPIQP